MTEGAGETRTLLLARVSNAVEWARAARSCVVTVILSEAEQNALLALLASAPAPAAERVEAAARLVLTTFQRDEAQGYRSRDRQFAIEVLSAALAAPLPPAEPPLAAAREAVMRHRVPRVMESDGTRRSLAAAVFDADGWLVQLAQPPQEQPPFKEGVAYMPVPRCETCKHWEYFTLESESLPDYGLCNNTTSFSGLLALAIREDAWMHKSFGCVQWELKPAEPPQEQP